MKKNLLALVLCMGFGFITAQAADPKTDSFNYPDRMDGKYSLKNNWIFSSTEGNYNTGADLIAAGNSTRGMVSKDGKLYFSSRDGGNKLIEVDGKTGKKIKDIKLPANAFTYLGKTKDGKNDSTWTVGLACNDIQKDAAGNLLVCNLLTSASGVFQVWRVNPQDGSAVLVLHTVPKVNNSLGDEAKVRFDAFGVFGDLSKDGYILAQNASEMNTFRWDVTDGKADPEASIFDIDVSETSYFKGLTNPGSAPRVYPISDTHYYMDGNTTLVTLLQMDTDAGKATVADGFYNKPSALFDSITPPVADPKEKWEMNQGHNGMMNFQVGDQHFVVMAATNTAKAPASSFRLFKYANKNKAFSGLDCLWTFPAAGMGATSDAYRTAVPNVEVNGNKATIYLYVGENGYASYEFTVKDGNNVAQLNNDAVKVSVKGKTVELSPEVASLLVYSASGALVTSAQHVSEIRLESGMYLIKATTYAGEIAIHKVVVR